MRLFFLKYRCWSMLTLEEVRRHKATNLTLEMYESSVPVPCACLLVCACTSDCAQNMGAPWYCMTYQR